MQLCGSLSILWDCLSLGLEWKLTFSSLVAAAEFFKFASILSAALVMPPKAHLTSHSRMSGLPVSPVVFQLLRLLYPSLSPRVCSNSCPLSRWCHPIISSSVVPFSSILQSFLASGYFPVSWLFTSDGQSTGASASVLPMNIQGWFPLGLIGLISLLSKGLSRIFSSTTTWKHQLFGAQTSNSHIHTWLLEKRHL